MNVTLIVDFILVYKKRFNQILSEIIKYKILHLLFRVDYFMDI